MISKEAIEKIYQVMAASGINVELLVGGAKLQVVCSREKPITCREKDQIKEFLLLVTEEKVVISLFFDPDLTDRRSKAQVYAEGEWKERLRKLHRLLVESDA